MTNVAGPEVDPAHTRIAVAIPCFNEAAAIATVVAQFRAALPDAAIVVYDNNSTDGTGEIARGLGVRVVSVPQQGKGHAVRAAFADLSEFDVVVLTDGDGTYPADQASALIAPVCAGAADMTVGARQPGEGAGAMTVTRGLGNKLIRLAFWLLIGPGTTDLFRATARSIDGSVRRSRFGRRALRSKPSWPARRSRGNWRWSKSPSHTIRESPVPKASSGRFAMGGESWSRSSARAQGFVPIACCWYGWFPASCSP